MPDPAQSHRPDQGKQTEPSKTAGQTKSRDLAAKSVAIGHNAVQQAKALERDAPDLAEQVQAGVMAIDAAEQERKERIRQQPKPPKERSSPAKMITLYTHDGRPVEYPEPQGKPTFNETRGEGISWAAWSWNPAVGCLRNCTNRVRGDTVPYCYASEIATSERYKSAYPNGFEPTFHAERLDAPIHTRIPAKYRDNPDPAVRAAWRRVFVCSMADLYGRWVPDEWIRQVHKSMLATPDWEYLLLTKFPSRYVGLDFPPSAWVGTSVDEQKRVRIAEDASARSTASR